MLWIFPPTPILLVSMSRISLLPSYALDSCHMPLFTGNMLPLARSHLPQNPYPFSGATISSASLFFFVLGTLLSDQVVTSFCFSHSVGNDSRSPFAQRFFGADLVDRLVNMTENEGRQMPFR